MDTDRRSFVKASGLGALLGATGLSGCSGILGGGGGAGMSWLYDPSALAQVPNVGFATANYRKLYSIRDQLPGSVSEDFETSPDSPLQPGDISTFAGVAGGDISTTTGSGSGFGSGVMTGSVPRSEMEAEIETTGEATSVGSYQNYSLYEVGSFQDALGSVPSTTQYQGSGALAIGDSALVAGAALAQGSQTRVSGREAVQTMIDAKSGNAPALSARGGRLSQVQNQVGGFMIGIGVEIDPQLAQLAQEQGPGGFGSGGGSMLSGIRGGGMGMNVGANTTTMKFVLAYNSARSASDSGITTLVSQFGSRLERQPGFQSINANQNGALVTVTIKGDTQTIFEQGAPTAGGGAFNVQPPGVSF